MQQIFQVAKKNYPDDSNASSFISLNLSRWPIAFFNIFNMSKSPLSCNSGNYNHTVCKNIIHALKTAFEHTGQHQTLVPIPLLRHQYPFQPSSFGGIQAKIGGSVDSQADQAQRVNPEGRQIAEVISLGTGLAIGEEGS